MRRTISILSGLGLLALGLGFATPLTAASASGDDECRGDVVVQVGAWLWARPGHDSVVVALPQPLSPGTWSVSTESFDEYRGRRDSDQDHEQWMLQLLDETGIVATLGPTADIPDGSDSGESSDQLGFVTLDRAVDAIRVVHYVEPSEHGDDSVTASCVGFDLVSPPSTTTSLPTTTPPTTTSATTSTTTTTIAPDPTSPPTSTPLPATSTTTTSPVDPGGDGEPQGTGGQGPGKKDTTPDPAIIGIQRPSGAIARLSTAVDCTTGTISAVVSNEGDQAALVDVFLVMEAARTGIDLAPGDSAQVDFAIPEAAEGRILGLVVSDDTGVADTGRVLVDCQRPAEVSASVLVDCPSDSIRVGLTNSGQESEGVDVLVERSGRIATIDLAGGESVAVDVPSGGLVEVPLRIVDSDGTDILRRVIAIDCPRPKFDASFSVSCISGEILVSVSNRGDAAGRIETMTDLEVVDDVEVRPGSAVVIGLPFGPESVLVPLLVSTLDGDEIGSWEVRVGCDRALPETSVPCASISLVGGLETTTTIVSTPPPGDPWWVDAGSLPLGDAAPLIGASRSCAIPSAEFAVDCAAGTLGLSLSNEGSIGTRIAILLDGRADGPGVDVGPDGRRDLSLGIADIDTVTLIEAGRAEPLTTFDPGCGKGDGAAKTISYVVFSLSILGSLLAMAIDPRKWLLLLGR